MFTREITAKDIKATEKNRIRYSSKHIKHLPPGTITDFVWKDYCPSGFRLIQELEDIDHDEYKKSVCNDETLRKLSSGKVGNVFLLSKDDRFIIKILRKSEIKVILEMLPGYFRHIHKYRSTLLSKNYGAHSIKPVGGDKTYFVVISNILQSDVFMNKVYDLKGSPQGRTNKKIKVRDKTILKDIDLDFCFYVDPLARHRIIKQTKLDCEVLEDEGIMDYSLMLGLQVKGSCQGSIDRLTPVYDSFTSRGSAESHSSMLMKTASNSPDRSSAMYSCTPSSRCDLNPSLNDVLVLIINTIETTPSPFIKKFVIFFLTDSTDSDNSVNTQSVSSVCPSPAPTHSSVSAQESITSKSNLTNIFQSSSSTKFGMKISGRARRIEKGESGSTVGKNIKGAGGEEWYDVILYLGIIDIFQDYGVRKRLEHCYKSIQHSSKTISAVHPKIYSSRFQDFVSQIFLPDENPSH